MSRSKTLAAAVTSLLAPLLGIPTASAAPASPFRSTIEARCGNTGGFYGLGFINVSITMGEDGTSGTTAMYYGILNYVKVDGVWKPYDGLDGGYSDYFVDDAASHSMPPLSYRTSARPSDSRNKFFPYAEGRELKSVVLMKWFGGAQGHIKPIHTERVTVCRFLAGTRT